MAWLTTNVTIFGSWWGLDLVLTMEVFEGVLRTFKTALLIYHGGASGIGPSGWGKFPWSDFLSEYVR